MPGEEIKIGPFIGGLNTFSDPTAIEDTELTELVNFELDLDGSLVSRPPIVDINVTMTLGVTGNMKILGFFITSSGAPYLIASDGLNSTYYFDGTSWTLITNTIAASAVCQFRDKAWLLSPVGVANPGGTWNPSAGFVTEPNMPRGAVIVANKERLWVGLGPTATTNGTRLYLTDLVSGVPTWAATPSFIDIGPGDGQNIVDLAVYYSDLVVFKSNSTYRFVYDADPSVGQVNRISDNIGAAGPYSHAMYENRIYVLFDNKVYEFSNYSYDRLNYKVPLKANNPNVTLSEYYNISVWSDRLFVSYYDRTFVYSLRTRTWCEWSSTVLTNIGKIYPLPFAQSVTPTAYTYSTVPRANKLYRIKDVIGSETESMTCYFVTKNYDYLSPQKYKRLFWWGADVLCKTTLNVEVRPISYVATVTWDQLAAYTWDQLGTWDRPINVSYTVADSTMTQGTTGERKYVKFFKSLRFRMVSFKLQTTTDGSLTQAPVRVYRLMTGVRDKAMVTKRIS